MKALYLAVAIFVLVALSAHAEIEPVMFRIDTNTTYTVPAGKVLAIQNVIVPSSSSSLIFGDEASTNGIPGSFLQQYHGSSTSHSMVNYPLIVPGGTVLLTTTSVLSFIVFPTSPKASVRKERFGFLFWSIGVCMEIMTVSP